VSELFPAHFAPVAQLPQTPQGGLDGVIAELRRTVALGFVGCNVNPDPSGTWAGVPITHPSWFPLWEAVEQLDIPAMIHVSTACNPNFHTLGAHYLNADTSVFVQLLQSTLFQRFPGLRLVIPHGGGAVPYHWGRYRGLAMRNGWQDPAELLRNVYFDTCVYHQAGVDLLTRVVPAGNVLFASEMLGAVRGADPETGVPWDDTLHYVDHAGLDAAALAAIHAGNARRVYPALDRRIAARGR
jgi:4-oxalmesaconate hydratase